jgi:hypothetical protein
MDEVALRRLAKSQKGLFTRAQARGCGYSSGQIRRRVNAGTWQRLTGPVLAMPGVVVTPRLRDRAAQLAQPGSVLAGPSAARAWGMPVTDDVPHLIVLPQTHSRPRGARIMRTLLDRRDIQSCDGSRVTSRPRTVVDCLRTILRFTWRDLVERPEQVITTIRTVVAQLSGRTR